MWKFTEKFLLGNSPQFRPEASPIQYPQLTPWVAPMQKTDALGPVLWKNVTLRQSIINRP